MDVALCRPPPPSPFQADHTTEFSVAHNNMVLLTAPDSHSESKTFMCLLLYAVCGSRVGCPLVPMLTGLVTAQLTRDELHMAFLPPSAPYHHRVIDKGRAAAPVRGPTAGPVRGCLYTSRSGEAASNKPLPHTAAPVCVAYTPVARTHMPSTRAAPPVARRKRGPLSARGEARAEL